MQGIDRLTEPCPAAENPGGIPSEVRRLLSAKFFDAAECGRWFLDRYYPDGPCCPICRAPVVSGRSLQNFRALRRFTCSACGAQPRPTKGTVLQDSSLSPRELFLIAALCAYGIDQREVARVLDLSLDTIRTWRDKFAALAEVGH